jgi:hypothetical protein
MNTERIKEIQSKTAYPESISVQQALLQVWNECVQEQLRIGAVMESDCEHEWINDSFDHFGFLTGQVCDKCGAKQSVP